jgi:hypothetical protein
MEKSSGGRVSDVDAFLKMKKFDIEKLIKA